MGLLDKFMGIGGAKSDSKKDEIRGIFNSKVENGESYIVLAGMNMVTTKKLLKEVRTYYNYILGYKDGDDPEIVLMSTTNDLSSVDTPVTCRKSECDKAVFIEKTASYSISHPNLADSPTDFSIIASAAWGAPGSGALVIPVAYLDESMVFMEFFQNRFAK